MTKKKSKKRDSPEIDPRFAPLVKAFSKHKNVTAGMLMASYGLKVNGKIFAMFGRNKFVAKLPKNRVDELVASGIAERFDPGHGRLMKEWASLAANDSSWLDLAKEAYRFVEKGSR